MRIVYTVVETDAGWSVRRGHTSSLTYESQDRARRAAENLARAATAHGDSAAVKIIQGDEVSVIKIYSPQWVPIKVS